MPEPLQRDSGYKSSTGNDPLSFRPDRPGADAPEELVAKNGESSIEVWEDPDQEWERLGLSDLMRDARGIRWDEDERFGLWYAHTAFPTRLGRVVGARSRFTRPAARLSSSAFASEQLLSASGPARLRGGRPGCSRKNAR